MQATGPTRHRRSEPGLGGAGGAVEQGLEAIRHDEVLPGPADGAHCPHPTLLDTHGEPHRARRARPSPPEHPGRLGSSLTTPPAIILVQHGKTSKTPGCHAALPASRGGALLFTWYRSSRSLR